MKFSVTINEMDEFFLLDLQGTVTASKIGAIQSYLYSDEAYVDKPKVVWDFTHCKSLLKQEDMAKLAKLTKINRHHTVKGKTAFVANEDDLNLGLLNEYMKQNSVDVIFELFFKLEDAIFWVTL